MELMLKDWQQEDMVLGKGFRQLRLGTSNHSQVGKPRQKVGSQGLGAKALAVGQWLCRDLEEMGPGCKGPGCQAPLAGQS